MEALTPPAPMAGDWKTIFTGVSTLAEETVQYGQDRLAKNTAAIKSLVQSSAPVLNLTRTTAKRNGFKYCSAIP